LLDQAATAELTLSKYEISDLKFMALKVLHSVDPRNAAILLEAFSNEVANCGNGSHIIKNDGIASKVAVKLLWAGYAQLQPSYSSNVESAR
jgi:hypothetical protein